MSHRHPHRHLRDPSEATEPEAEDFANRWGLYANQHLRDQEKPRSPNQEQLDEVRWGDSKLFTFVFGAGGTQSLFVPQIIDVTTPGRVWSVHIAMTLLSQVLPVGDAVNAFVSVKAGVGSSIITMSRALSGASMVVNPFDPTSQLTTDLIIPDVPARKLMASAVVTYTAAIAETMNVRIDVAASPVMR